jgi:hypothetical protein
MSCELICTGWYSSEVPRDYETFGDNSIRNKSFRPLWWQSVDNFIMPQHVLIVDSASPVKPDDHLYTSTKFSNIELLKNPGHSQNCKTHYCGAMAAIIIGLEFALHNDVDFFIYVEQDALVYGADFVKKIKHQLLRDDLVFGAGYKHGEVEQTIFAANKKGIRKFLSAIHNIGYTDRQISPEVKFMNAASSLNLFPFIGLLSADNPRLLARASTKLFISSMSIFKQYSVLPFGYGRVRPINFSDDIFYFQQGSVDEISAYKKLTGFNDIVIK